LFLSGCSGSSLSKSIKASDKIDIRGTLTSQSYNIPISNAQIIIDNKVIATDSSGRFSATGLSSGSKEIKIKKDDQFIVLNKNLKESTDNYALRPKSKLNILHFTDHSEYNNYQYSIFYLANMEEKISSAILNPPGVDKKKLKYKGENLNIWWNEKDFIEGQWKLELNGSNIDLNKYYSTEIKDIPFRAKLFSPSNNAIVESTTPLLEFETDANLDKVFVRIEKDNLPEKEHWLKVDPNSTSFKIPERILESGEVYNWKVHSVRLSGLNISYESLSDNYSFKVK
jgi:hypothetical protein